MANQLTQAEKTHYTNLWCRQIGIQSRDLENHPTIDDAILLINFHKATWADLTREERGVWSAYWSYVYHKQCNLKEKHLKKLEIITNSVIFRQQKQEQRRATIHAMRQRLTAKA